MRGQRPLAVALVGLFTAEKTELLRAPRGCVRSAAARGVGGVRHLEPARVAGARGRRPRLRQNPAGHLRVELGPAERRVDPVLAGLLDGEDDECGAELAVVAPPQVEEVGQREVGLRGVGGVEPAEAVRELVALVFLEQIEDEDEVFDVECARVEEAGHGDAAVVGRRELRNEAHHLRRAEPEARRRAAQQDGVVVSHAIRFRRLHLAVLERRLGAVLGRRLFVAGPPRPVVRRPAQRLPLANAVDARPCRHRARRWRRLGRLSRRRDRGRRGGSRGSRGVGGVGAALRGIGPPQGLGGVDTGHEDGRPAALVLGHGAEVVVEAFHGVEREERGDVLEASVGNGLIRGPRPRRRDEVKRDLCRPLGAGAREEVGRQRCRRAVDGFVAKVEPISALRRVSPLRSAAEGGLVRGAHRDLAQRPPTCVVRGGADVEGVVARGVSAAGVKVRRAHFLAQPHRRQQRQVAGQQNVRLGARAHGRQQRRDELGPLEADAAAVKHLLRLQRRKVDVRRRSHRRRKELEALRVRRRAAEVPHERCLAERAAPRLVARRLRVCCKNEAEAAAVGQAPRQTRGCVDEVAHGRRPRPLQEGGHAPCAEFVALELVRGVDVEEREGAAGRLCRPHGAAPAEGLADAL
mmetsp:Transcript_26971/g.96297  ORF Transcript_26971/g.96297 Transcript_26971/m.96297 type:complete len:635 (+) Transcript_26971:73-1977(+)